jgi:hypothetical protein
MAKGNPLVRVVNKSADGVTIKTMDGKFTDTLSWEDFNANFKSTEKPYLYEMVLNETVREQVDQMELRFKFLTPFLPKLLMIMNYPNRGLNPSVDELRFFGEVSRTYGERFPQCPPIQFVEDVQEMKRVLQQGF